MQPRVLGGRLRPWLLVVLAGPLVAAGACASPSTQAGAPARTSAAALRPVSTDEPGPASSATPAAPSRFRTLPGGVVLPDPALTPGAVFPGVTTAQVCAPDYAKQVAQVHLGARQKAFDAYDLDYSTHLRYEVDHLVPVSLGGDDAAANLWPEPLAGTDGARRKDAVEMRLVDLVCAHKVALSTAQHALASSWWAAYRTYGAVPAATLPLLGHPTVLAGAVGNGLACSRAGVTGYTHGKHVPLTCRKRADGTLHWAKRY